MYLFCISSKLIVATIKVPTLVETSWIRRPWPTGGCRAKNKQTNNRISVQFCLPLCDAFHSVTSQCRWGLEPISAQKKVFFLIYTRNILWFLQIRTVHLLPPSLLDRGAWMFVCCVCCQVEVSATSWSLVQRSHTDCGASLCAITKPREWGGPGPLGAVAPQTNKNNILTFN